MCLRLNKQYTLYTYVLRYFKYIDAAVINKVHIYSGPQFHSL